MKWQVIAALLPVVPQVVLALRDGRLSESELQSLAEALEVVLRRLSAS